MQKNECPKYKCECVDGKRTTIRLEEEKKSMLNRLKRIEGQIRGLQNMIENDAYCDDILQQSAAVNAAINGFNKVLLINHLKGCISEELKKGNDQVVDELANTLQKLMK